MIGLLRGEWAISWTLSKKTHKDARRRITPLIHNIKVLSRLGPSIVMYGVQVSICHFHANWFPSNSSAFSDSDFADSRVLCK